MKLGFMISFLPFAGLAAEFFLVYVETLTHECLAFKIQVYLIL